MKQKMPTSPFATRLSGSAKETELRIRNIFQWKKKRPPVLLVVLSALAVLFCCGLVSCQAQRELSSAEETQQDTVTPEEQAAPLEGEDLSPDGQYEVRLVGREGGVTSAGLVPSENIQICAAQTGEALWEGDGAYSHAVSWSPESNLLVLARTARTFCTVTVIETGSWASADVTLPGGSAIPEYTFLPEDGPWCEWLDENTFLLTVGRGEKSDGMPQRTYRCHFFDGQCFSAEQTTQILPGEYDFDHNGDVETIEIDTVWATSEKDGNVAWYELHIQNPDGGILWSGEANSSHAGWNSYFTCALDGKDYLLQYNPVMYQGSCAYSYRVFSLGAEGEEVVLQENSVSFDTNFGSPLFESFDANAIADFMDDVNSLLARSKLLLSTDDALADIDPEAPQDDLWWLVDIRYPGYERDESNTLRENLFNLQEAVEQHG